MPSSHVVQIEIRGHQYAVRTDLDPAYINQLAVYLDQKMRLAEVQTQNADLARVTVVAALNIADEFFSCARRQSGPRGTAARTRGRHRTSDRRCARWRAKAGNRVNTAAANFRCLAWLAPAG